MDENILNEETEEEAPAEVAEIIPPEDDTESLEIDTARSRKEGSAWDSISMQTALCMIIAVGLVVLNIFRPDTAEELFKNLREFSENAEKVIPNPIDVISEYIKSR